MSMHRLDLLARLLDLTSTDHPTSGAIILGDEASEENYELDAVLEAVVRRLMHAEKQAHEALVNCSALWKREADLGALGYVHRYVKEAGL